MNLTELFQLQFMMFAEMTVGYLLCKGKILTSDQRSVFSKAVVQVFLPCSIISSFKAELNMKTICGKNSIEYFVYFLTTLCI